MASTTADAWPARSLHSDLYGLSGDSLADQSSAYEREPTFSIARFTLRAPALARNSDLKAYKSHARMMEQLYRLRNEGLDPGYLSNSDLHFEVRTTGEGPFYSGSIHERWECVWPEERVVTLKVLRGNQPNRPPTKEARAVRRQHPNVLQLHGIMVLKEGETGGTSIGSITSWMPNRDVMRDLKMHPEANRIRLIYDTAKGLQYLQGIGILHDALQGPNVLVDDCGNAVLANFSLTEFTNPNMVMTRTGPGSWLRWWAPETIK
ncbi:hypothetical protein FRB97_003719 [Tulasnella sp. 331]|nr:hypothetical protein FRB97_003719 [Tulasnella sp. 331]